MAITPQRRDFTDLSGKFIRGQVNTTQWAHTPAGGTIVLSGIDIQGLSHVAFQLTPDDLTASACSLTIEGTIDGLTWYTIPGTTLIAGFGLTAPITIQVMQVRMSGSITGGPVSISLYALR